MEALGHGNMTKCTDFWNKVKLFLRLLEEENMQVQEWTAYSEMKITESHVKYDKKIQKYHAITTTLTPYKGKLLINYVHWSCKIINYWCYTWNILQKVNRKGMLVDRLAFPYPDQSCSKLFNPPVHWTGWRDDFSNLTAGCFKAPDPSYSLLPLQV